MIYFKTVGEWMSQAWASNHIDDLEEAVRYGTVEKRPEVVYGNLVSRAL